MAAALPPMLCSRSCRRGVSPAVLRVATRVAETRRTYARRFRDTARATREGAAADGKVAREGGSKSPRDAPTPTRRRRRPCSSTTRPRPSRERVSPSFYSGERRGAGRVARIGRGVREAPLPTTRTPTASAPPRSAARLRSTRRATNAAEAYRAAERARLRRSRSSPRSSARRTSASRGEANVRRLARRDAKDARDASTSSDRARRPRIAAPAIGAGAGGAGAGRRPAIARNDAAPAALGPPGWLPSRNADARLVAPSFSEFLNRIARRSGR